jgi:hypothetical protein
MQGIQPFAEEDWRNLLAVMRDTTMSTSRSSQGY